MADSDGAPRLDGIADPFRELVASVTDYAIFLLDAEGRVVSWNPGARRMKGYEAEEILGRHFSVFYPPEANAREWPAHELRMAATNGRFEDEGWRLRKDGSLFWANVVITALRDAGGRVRGYGKVTRDLTERRRIEALEKNERRTNEFLAMLAHELRNPLAPIRNALHLLSKKPTSDPAELWVREVLQRQTGQMTRLVDDLLDVSRITRNTVALAKAAVDVRKVAREAAAAAAQWMQARGHALVLALPEEPLQVDADPIRLNQIVLNLLHNAAKFTPHGGRIELRAQRDRDYIVVGVRDNGVGMTAELLRTAFELFTQGEQTLDRPEGGLGVGLTLVERLVALHGGSVEASSEGPGKGSEFRVRLPARAGAPAAPDAGAAADEPDVGARRVLVVDDNVDAANALRYLLENDGHEVKVATDGADGLALAQAFTPDVLLLDIGLPRLSGYEIARAVRADQRLARATLIAVTGYGQQQDRERSSAAGFDHHLTKPVEFRALQRLLRLTA